MRVSVPPSTLAAAGTRSPGASPTCRARRELESPSAPPQGWLGSRGRFITRERQRRRRAQFRPCRKSLAITPQLTLLGQRADEAVQNVEKYLDDAYAAGLSRARLVHGKGTGALRRAVQEYLQGHPLVDDYATADPEEGGAGATVVTLKTT